MDKLVNLTEAAMGMDEAAWARHANPWSGWSRVTILPLLALAVWSRVWIGWWAVVPVLAVLFWTWINPRLFPAPVRTDNWMSQGVLGEQVWLRRRGELFLAHHHLVVRALIALGVVGAVLLLLGLIVLNLAATLTGLAVAMLSKLWLLDRMVWVQRETAAHPAGG